jgi:hypothetical protein
MKTKNKLNKKDKDDIKTMGLSLVRHVESNMDKYSPATIDASDMFNVAIKYIDNKNFNIKSVIDSMALAVSAITYDNKSRINQNMSFTGDMRSDMNRSVYYVFGGNRVFANAYMNYVSRNNNKSIISKITGADKGLDVKYALINIEYEKILSHIDSMEKIHQNDPLKVIPYYRDNVFPLIKSMNTNVRNIGINTSLSNLLINEKLKSIGYIIEHEFGNLKVERIRDNNIVNSIDLSKHKKNKKIVNIA